MVRLSSSSERTTPVSQIIFHDYFVGRVYSANGMPFEVMRFGRFKNVELSSH